MPGGQPRPGEPEYEAAVRHQDGRPGDNGGGVASPREYVVVDADGVVVAARTAAAKDIELRTEYDAGERNMMPNIEREKSILKAIDICNRY